MEPAKGATRHVEVLSSASQEAIFFN